jgi:hypothetical protein
MAHHIVDTGQMMKKEILTDGLDFDFGSIPLQEC